MPGRTYEQSSEGGRERHVTIPYARLTDATPTLHDPCEVISAVPGTQITGVSITLDAVQSVAIINVAQGAVYRQNIRNCITYAGNVENAWRAVNIGDPVWYDNSATMVAGGWQLSTSPLDDLGVANTLFGHVVMLQNETAASFPKGIAIAPGSTLECAIQMV